MTVPLGYFSVTNSTGSVGVARIEVVGRVPNARTTTGAIPLSSANGASATNKDPALFNATGTSYYTLCKRYS